jgi:hypothetical protein
MNSPTAPVTDAAQPPMIHSPHLPPSEAVIQFRLSHGMCPGCGTRIYMKQMDGTMLEPITLDGIVTEGRCLFCYPNAKLPSSSSTAATLPAPQAVANSNTPVSMIKIEPMNESLTGFGGTVSSESNVAAPTGRRKRTYDYEEFFHDDEDDDEGDEDDDDDVSERSHHNNKPSRKPSSSPTTNHTTSHHHYRSQFVSIPDKQGCMYTGKLLSGTIRKGTVEVSYTRPSDVEEFPGRVSRYKGDIVNGLFDGQGHQSDFAGCVYEGAFQRGASNGYGVCRWPTGWIYEGEWVDDLRQGRGKCRHQSTGASTSGNSDHSDSDSNEDTGVGEEYDGEWKADMWHGRGMLKFAGGDVYRGEFRDDRMHGKGTYLFSDGSIYVGQFKKDVRSGRGNMTYADGQIYDGKWKNNWREGQGKLLYTDGSIFEGTFRSDDKADGLILMSDGIMRRVRNGQLER